MEEMEEAKVKWQLLTSEATERDQLFHSKSIIYQELMRIKGLLGKETGGMDTSTKSLNIQSEVDRIEYMLTKSLSGGVPDREGAITNVEQSREGRQEHLAFDLKEIEQRFNSLEKQETELQRFLADQREEFEMDKIALERERVHEKVAWDKYMKDREAFFLSSVLSVMMKREKVMEQLRNQPERQVRHNTLYQRSCHIALCGTRAHFSHVSVSSSSQSPFASSTFKNMFGFKRNRNNKRKTPAAAAAAAAAAKERDIVQVCPGGDVILLQNSDPKSAGGHPDSAIEAIRQREVQKIAQLKKSVTEAEMKMQTEAEQKAWKSEENGIKTDTQKRPENKKELGILHRMGWHTRTKEGPN
ncbi:hypothetical protein ACEWY4_004457 [Coilia grayii]|uniref:Uncharacterized protein n=1 Tax=Coilia grayii TaxID=363190 RepID=A0ABD1KLP4_9TELE